MISSISIGNFKAFADKQTLPIKPITLIFGANSSGKSSIIHSLLLANEALTKEELDLDIHFTKLGGESVDLGGFRQFVNNRDPFKNVLFEINIDYEQLPIRLKDIFYSAEKIKIIIEFGITNSDFIEVSEKPKINSFELIIDEILFLKMSVKGKGEMQMDVINTENIISKSLFDALIRSYTTSEKILDEDKISYRNALVQLVPKLKAKMNKIFPDGLKGLEEFTDLRVNAASPIMQPINKENRNEVIKQITINVLPFILDEMFMELDKYILEEISKLSYLGPLRSYPERHFSFRKTNDNNWYAGGGHSWEVVSRNKEVRNKVNEWLGSEKIKTQYKLEVVEMIPENILKNEMPNKILDSDHDSIVKFILNSSEAGGESDPIDITAEEVFRDLMLSFENYDPESYFDLNDFDIEDVNNILKGVIEDKESGYTKSEIIVSLLSTLTNYEDLTKKWIKDFLNLRSESISDLILVDKNTNTNVSLRDVGIGISQVLPVLVSAYANKEKLIAIEQPEIHLHPALQAELGDLFINSALGENKNTFILETHSEHLILRVMRRIRETTNGSLPEGVCPIKPEDVQIVFVEPFEGKSIIRNMPLNEEGELVKSWPGGFFEEGLREVL